MCLPSLPSPLALPYQVATAGSQCDFEAWLLVVTGAEELFRSRRKMQSVAKMMARESCILPQEVCFADSEREKVSE